MSHNSRRIVNPSSMQGYFGKAQINEFNPTKCGKNTAHTIFILDRSYSMQPHLMTTISGFNEFLMGQVQSEVQTDISLYTFSYDTSREFASVPAQEFPPLNTETYVPNGGTALYDAIGQAMTDINRELSMNPEGQRPSVQFVILTDGEENSSCKYTGEVIKNMISRAEEAGWTFMFLGANIDAFAAGSQIGMRSSNTIQYGMDNIGSVMASASRYSNDMKSAATRGLSVGETYANYEFTDKERNDAQK